MNTKRIFIRLSVVLMAIVIMIVGYRHIVPSHVVSIGDRIWIPDNLEDIEQHADLIIIGTALSTAGKINYWPGENRPTTGTTSTLFRIDTVFKSDNTSITEGTIIEIWEPHIYYRRPEGLYLVRPDDYLPMNHGQSYLLFLERSIIDGFTTKYSYAITIPEGKFVVDASDLSPKELEIPSGKLPHYISIYQQAGDKYLNR